ncbi:MAG: ABC transporter permease [Candidatus Limnocylindrales bacterium]
MTATAQSRSAPNGAARQRACRAARGLLVVALLLALWYLAAWFVRATGDTSATAKLPYPHDVLATVAAFAPTFLDATWSTGSRAVAGFFVGLAIGTAFAVVMIQSRWLERAFVPYVLASQMIPLIALVPILRAVLKDADLVRLYVTAYVSFFIVTIAVLRGLKNATPTALELMGSINSSRWTTLRYLRFPAALPFIFSGLRVAAPLSLIGAILVDFLGARNGLGYLMVASLSIGSSQSTVLWAALVIALCLGLVFTQLVAVAERRLSFWQPAFRSSAP